MFEEIKDEEEKLEMTENEIEDLFDSLDLNGSGVIDYTEFIAAFTLNEVYQNETYLLRVFKTLDQVILYKKHKLILLGW